MNIESMSNKKAPITGAFAFLNAHGIYLLDSRIISNTNNRIRIDSIYMFFMKHINLYVTNYF